MKKIIITKEMSSQRLDKYLKRLLPSCSSGLLYKQLRKKNITLNGSKADGHEIIEEGDSVEIFFSDETFEKFSSSETEDLTRYNKAYEKYKNSIEVVAFSEDLGFVVFNKPAGILSQSDKTGDMSINDYLIGFLFNTGYITEESFKMSKPSILNRLDRNTSGLIFCSMNLKGDRFFKAYNSSYSKNYLALVHGKFDREGVFEDYIKKDEQENKVYFTDKDDPDALDIKTGFELVKTNGKISLVKVRLYTGRSHQIRAHLSHFGFPIIGDTKYGKKDKEFGVSRQLLHAYSMEPEEYGRFMNFNFKADLPKDMTDICIREFGPIEEYLK
jgi:23S rRNA pseudouridine955/2504/2580 synthase